MIYFDFNATTPIFPEVAREYHENTVNYWQNPSSLYRGGAKVHALLDCARKELAGYLSAPPGDIVFTSGATESNNAVWQYVKKLSGEGRSSVVISPFEHPSVAKTARFYFDGKVEIIPLTSDGHLDLNWLEARLEQTPAPVLISVQAVNNESGLILPWKKVALLCRQRGILFHCDASQWLGKLPPEELNNCHFVTGCAHKFGGPKGVGFIKICGETGGFQSLLGGGQEAGHRAGTENYPAIRALVSALLLASRKAQKKADAQRELRDRFENTVKQLIPGVRIVAEQCDRTWNTSTLIMPRHNNDRWVRLLDKRGVAIATGSACSSTRHKPSSVLLASGFNGDEARRGVRISAGWDTTEGEWERLLDELTAVWVELEHQSGTTTTGSFVIEI